MIKQVGFEQYQNEIVSMMRDMVHLEPQDVQIPVGRYIELDKMGVLKPILWFDGVTVKGVALLFVSASLRNPAIVDASTDVLWVKPKHRGSSRMFVDGIKRLLKEMGVLHWHVSSRTVAPIDKFLIRNQFEPLERVFMCEV